MNTLKAEKRSMDIKAKKLRREGFVTGNVFGREIKESIPLQMISTDVEQLLKKSGKGSEIILELEGKSIDVLIKDVEYNSMKRQVEEIDFQALVSGEKVHSVAEVVLLNHEKVTTGILEQFIHELQYKALPSALVEKVEIDVSEMRVGDSIQVKDLAIAKDKDVSLHMDLNATVVKVLEARNTVVDDDKEETTAEE